MAHSISFFYIGAEHNGLGHAANFVKHLRNAASNLLAAGLDNEFAAKIRTLIQLLRNDVTEKVQFLRAFWRPAFQVHIQETVCHAVRSKEAIFDSLLQRIREKRFAKVFQVVRSKLDLWRRRHANLRCTTEIF